ncbi:auxin-responsive protein SAUR21-like [Hordeum vulgare subsp. vulgare]|uniref:Auxin-responsive protein n=1 Tax=Hordeum vulgare subsp. vulgare TaxID=112509 RepID=A0A8I6X110_HORVV|nr:auxin-responsive protein SAUR21-like [Hordeum vulgare subsp. vulgare]
MCKVIGTVQSLAWLRRAVRRWRSRSAASVRRLAKDMLDAAVPAGHVAVRAEGSGAGESSSRRFAVPLAQLSHPAFWELLRQAEEEYGFPSAPGPLVLPCDEGHLRDVLRRVSSSNAEGCRSFRRRSVMAAPLLQGAR